MHHKDLVQLRLLHRLRNVPHENARVLFFLLMVRLLCISASLAVRISLGNSNANDLLELHGQCPALLALDLEVPHLLANLHIMLVIAALHLHER